MVTLSIWVSEVTTMDSDVRDILDHYGVRVPEDVGRSAYRTGDTFPAVEVRECDGCRLGSEWMSFMEVGGDGVVVRVMCEDGGVQAYYAMEADIVQSCVSSLVNHTDFVVVEGDDEYLPPSVLDDEDNEDEEDEFQFVEEYREDVGGFERGDEVVRTSEPTSDHFHAVD